MKIFTIPVDRCDESRMSAITEYDKETLPFDKPPTILAKTKMMKLLATNQSP